MVDGKMLLVMVDLCVNCSGLMLQDYLVETIRSMAELLIWGDQHDPAFFE